MAKLCDIVKPGVSCRIKCGGATFVWSGSKLVPDINECGGVSHKCLIFDDDWQLDEPTVESVLNERGYLDSKTWECYTIETKYIVYPRITMDANKRPTTVAQIAAICDLLDKYR